jgi:hypothetical protein
MSAKKLEEQYLDYVNNFITVDAFASHYGYTEKKALNVLKLGRAYNTAKAK